MFERPNRGSAHPSTIITENEKCILSEYPAADSSSEFRSVCIGDSASILEV
jgi:hypothetical protein